MYEMRKFRDFLINYNNELEKEKQRQELIKLKTAVLQAEKEFNALCENQQYFSTRQLEIWKKTWSHISEPVENFLKRGSIYVDFKDAVVRVNDIFQQGEQLIERRNTEFVEKEIIRFKDFFDSLESYPLTDDQRRAIVTDEESCLVVAGAGTGKTSTIIGKAGYLVKKGLAAPEEILLMAFNKDVAS